MFKKKIILLSIFLVGLLAISAVSAAENITEDVSSADMADTEIALNTDDVVFSTENNSKLSEWEDDYGYDYDDYGYDYDDYGDDFEDDYDNMVLKSTSKSHPYASGADFYVYWDGYFEGWLKVYNGNKCIATEYLDEYSEGQWISYSVPVGTYVAKVVDRNNNVIKTSTITVKKAKCEIDVDTISLGVLKPNQQKRVYIYVGESTTGNDIKSGKIQLKINGKTYKANLKDGYASVLIKAPSTAKKYTVKVTLPGTKNYYGSSVSFKLTVKKQTSKKTTTSTKKKSTSKNVIITVNSKNNREVIKRSGKFTISVWKWNGGSIGGLDIIVYKNGKQLSRSKYYSRGYTNAGGYWHWTIWSKAAKGYEMKHHYPKGNNVQITKVQVKVRT